MSDELSEARRAAAELRRLQEAARELPQLEAEAAADARRAEAVGELGAAVMFAPPSEPGGEEARALRAVNAELRRLGAGADAYELEPLPPVDAKQYPWAALQMELVPRFVRRIFHPALGARNILQPRVMPTVG